ncbi:hypothetical protein [Hyella patelloides]|uniref:hypothetical protein n=1 Tax=Hyella patelloides TaxID=1982969 RepID=UPI0011A18742|nr:hypothetical protein [Hyella patelloides]
MPTLNFLVKQSLVEESWEGRSRQNRAVARTAKLISKKIALEVKNNNRCLLMDSGDLNQNLTLC